MCKCRPCLYNVRIIPLSNADGLSKQITFLNKDCKMKQLVVDTIVLVADFLETNTLSQVSRKLRKLLQYRYLKISPFLGVHESSLTNWLSGVLSQARTLSLQKTTRSSLCRLSRSIDLSYDVPGLRKLSISMHHIRRGNKLNELQLSTIDSFIIPPAIQELTLANFNFISDITTFVLPTSITTLTLWFRDVVHNTLQLDHLRDLFASLEDNMPNLHTLRLGLDNAWTSNTTTMDCLGRCCAKGIVDLSLTVFGSGSFTKLESMFYAMCDPYYGDLRTLHLMICGTTREVREVLERYPMLFGRLAHLHLEINEALGLSIFDLCGDIPDLCILHHNSGAGQQLQRMRSKRIRSRESCWSLRMGTINPMRYGRPCPAPSRAYIKRVELAICVGDLAPEILLRVLPQLDSLCVILYNNRKSSSLMRKVTTIRSLLHMLQQGHVNSFELHASTVVVPNQLLVSLAWTLCGSVRESILLDVHPEDMDGGLFNNQQPPPLAKSGCQNLCIRVPQGMLHPPMVHQWSPSGPPVACDLGRHHCDFGDVTSGL